MTTDKNKKKWFAIYVKSRNEKKVFNTLDSIGVESFLPLITKMKQWSDRRKKVEEPLFRSYLFVCIPLSDYYKVLNVSGVVKFICFEKKPVEVPDLLCGYAWASDPSEFADFIYQWETTGAVLLSDPATSLCSI